MPDGCGAKVVEEDERPARRVRPCRGLAMDGGAVSEDGEGRAEPSGEEGAAVAPIARESDAKARRHHLHAGAGEPPNRV